MPYATNAKESRKQSKRQIMAERLIDGSTVKDKYELNLYLDTSTLVFYLYWRYDTQDKE